VRRGKLWPGWAKLRIGSTPNIGRASSGPRLTLSDVLDYAGAVGRLILGPLIVAVFSGVELARYGVFTAAAAAYFVFAVTQVAVDAWNRFQLRQARRRLAFRREGRRNMAD
jgi:hypothetical protein